MNHNVFSGENSLQNYLDPDNHPPLPLVEVPSFLNPLRDRGVRIFLKLMHFLPLGHVKSLPAYNMLQKARQEGKVDGVDSLVESSSGDTACSLSFLVRSCNIRRSSDTH